jgi:outer membrane protein, multidrug efflux system
MTLRARAALAVIVLMAPACALKAPPDAASIRAEGMSKVAIPERFRAPGAAPTGMLEANWVAGFQDDQLTAAIIEAIRNNPDLIVAAERVQQAILRANLAGARLYPSVDVLARGGTKLSGDNSGIQGVLLTANWELDLWGRVRYGRAAATADAEASRADFEFARQSMAAIVARNWMLAIEAGLQAEIARATIREGEELIRLAETRARVGVGNSEEIYIARATVGSYRDALREIELAREQAVRSLELLLGRYPAAAAAVTPTLPRQPDPVPAGLPSALLERRPDVIAAERRVAAAFNRVGEAKAARLPAIALTSGVSAISSELFVLKDHSNPVWNLGANLVAPLFQGGALKTQVEIRTAEQRQAVAAYASVGLRAFGDVESALAAEGAARDREAILTETLADYQRAYEIVQTQFRVGSTDLRLVTQRQLTINATNAALIRVQVEQRIQRVNLYLALGGGY